MRAVLDTNVLISATLSRGGNEDRILRAWKRGLFDLVLSPQILEEMGRALLYEKLQRYRWMNEREVVELVELLAQESLLVGGNVSVKACRDPDDDKFLAAAIEASAEYIVSVDKDLLNLKSYGNAMIVAPASFRKILQRAEKRGK